MTVILLNLSWTRKGRLLPHQTLVVFDWDPDQHKVRWREKKKKNIWYLD